MLISVGAVDCSVLERIDSSLQLRRSVYISSMAVRAEFRRKGIGRAMLETVDAHAAGVYGVSHVCLHVEEWNTSALAIYAAASFTKAGMDDKGAAYLDRCGGPSRRAVRPLSAACSQWLWRTLGRECGALTAGYGVEEAGRGAGFVRCRYMRG